MCHENSCVVLNATNALALRCWVPALKIREYRKAVKLPITQHPGRQGAVQLGRCVDGLSSSDGQTRQTRQQALLISSRVSGLPTSSTKGNDVNAPNQAKLVGTKRHILEPGIAFYLKEKNEVATKSKTWHLDFFNPAWNTLSPSQRQMVSTRMQNSMHAKPKIWLKAVVQQMPAASP